MKKVLLGVLFLFVLFVFIITPYVWEYYHPYIKGDIVRCDGGGKA